MRLAEGHKNPVCDQKNYENREQNKRDNCPRFVERHAALAVVSLAEVLADEGLD